MLPTSHVPSLRLHRQFRERLQLNARHSRGRDEESFNLRFFSVLAVLAFPWRNFVNARQPNLVNDPGGHVGIHEWQPPRRIALVAYHHHRNRQF